MSNYLRLLKVHKKRIDMRALESRALVPSPAMLEVMTKKDDNVSYKTYVSDPIINLIARNIWVNPSGDQIIFVRLIISLWISGGYEKAPVHFIKEYFYDVLGNPSDVSANEVIMKIIAEIKKDPQLDYIQLTPEMKQVHATLMDISSVAAYKEKIKEVIDDTVLVKLIKALYEQNVTFLKSMVEYISGVFLLSFIKTGSVTSYHIEKRLKNFSMSDYLILPEYTSEDFKTIYEIIKSQIDNEDLDPNEIISYFSTLLDKSTNMTIKPLVNQASYRNLTALFIISKSFSEFPDFPWGPLLSAMPSLRVEAQRVFEILKAIGSNNLIGYQISGTAASFANLAGLCIQLQVVVKHQHTLNEYRGVGSLSNIGKVQHDKFRKWATDYSLMTEGQAVNITDMMKNDTITSEFFKLSLVSEALTSFLSEKISEIDDDDSSDDLKKFFGGKGPGDDDDDQGPSTSRQAPKRPLDHESAELDRPPSKQPNIPSAPPAYTPTTPIYPQLEGMEQDVSPVSPRSAPPLTAKTTVMDIPKHGGSHEVPEEQHELLSTMITTITKSNVDNVIPSFVLNTIQETVPKDQMISVPSYSKIMMYKLSIKKNWTLFKVRESELAHSYNVVLAIGIESGKEHHKFKKPVLMTGPSGSRPFSTIIPKLLPSFNSEISAFIGVALFIITS